MNSWIDEQIEEEMISLENKIKNDADLTPTNFIEAYLIEMKTNKEFDGKLDPLLIYYALKQHG